VRIAVGEGSMHLDSSARRSLFPIPHQGARSKRNSAWALLEYRLSKRNTRETMKGQPIREGTFYLGAYWSYSDWGAGGVEFFGIASPCPSSLTLP